MAFLERTLPSKDQTCALRRGLWKQIPCKRPDLRSAEVLVEEFERPFARDYGRVRVVALALIAVETVLGTVVHEYLDLAVRGLELAHAVDGNRRVPLAEVRHHGALRMLIGCLRYAPAVVGDGATEAVEPCRRHPGDETAPAIADDSNVTHRRNGSPGGSDVRERSVGLRARL